MISLDTLKTLEYDKIIEMLKNRTGSDYGKELADQLMPSVEPAEVIEWNNETQEASSIIYASYMRLIRCRWVVSVKFVH